MDGLEISLELETNETIQFIQLFLIFSYKLKASGTFWFAREEI